MRNPKSAEVLRPVMRNATNNHVEVKNRFAQSQTDEYDNEFPALTHPAKAKAKTQRIGGISGNGSTRRSSPAESNIVTQCCRHDIIPGHVC